MSLRVINMVLEWCLASRALSEFTENLFTDFRKLVNFLKKVFSINKHCGLAINICAFCQNEIKQPLFPSKNFLQPLILFFFFLALS